MGITYGRLGINNVRLGLSDGRLDLNNGRMGLSNGRLGLKYGKMFWCVAGTVSYQAHIVIDLQQTLLMDSSVMLHRTKSRQLSNSKLVKFYVSTTTSFCTI